MNFNEPKKLMDFLTNKKESGMYKASIVRRLEEIFETYPNIKFGEILHYILKSTGDLSDPINWTDSNSLKKLENVQRQIADTYNIDNELFDKNDEQIDEEFLNSRVNKFPEVYGK